MKATQFPEKLFADSAYQGPNFHRALGILPAQAIRFGMVDCSRLAKDLSFILTQLTLSGRQGDFRLSRDGLGSAAWRALFAKLQSYSQWGR